MFKLKSKLIVAVMVIFGITAFMSCEKENAIENKEKSDLVGAGIGAGAGLIGGPLATATVPIGAVSGACYSSARGIVALAEHWGLW